MAIGAGFQTPRDEVGEVVRNAVAFNFKNSGEEILDADSLSRSVEPLLLELSGYLGPMDLAAVRDIVSEIQARIERFRVERSE